METSGDRPGQAAAGGANGERGGARRVGPQPGPPPERLDAMVALDLLATVRRWRVNEPFVAGQADGLSRAFVACLNVRRPVPRWLRHALLAYLMEALWERPRPRGAGSAEWDEEVVSLLARWREPRRTGAG